MWYEAIIPTEDICATLYEWRKDPSVVEASVHNFVPDSSTFFRQLRCDYFSLPDLPPFFVRQGDERVAFVRFTPFKREGDPSFVRSSEISVMVHPSMRRHGIGTDALHAAERFAKEQMYHTLYACVRPENIASKALFEKGGYSYCYQKILQKQELYGQQEAVVDLYEKHLHDPLQAPHVFIIAEIGSNWQVGSRSQRRQMAQQLIEAAAKAKVDAVKFQTFRSQSVYAKNAGAVGYLKNQDISELFAELEMAYEDIPFLHGVAERSGLEFLSTPFSEADFEAVDPYVHFHKVASYELSHSPLLKKVAHSGKTAFVSTGASSMHEIAYAIDLLKKENCHKIVLMQCTAAYPAPPQAMNMFTLPILRQSFNVDVGLSDHSLDCSTAPLMAVSLGACAIEKHITLDRQLKGPDQKFAIEPHELCRFVEQVRLAEQMSGTQEKTVFDAEMELFRFAKRRLQALCDIKQGDIIQEGVNVSPLRPGNNRPGAHPSFASSIYGKKAIRTIAMGEGVDVGDVS